MRQYMKDRYYERKAQAVALLGGKCVRCGAVEDLEFDHIDPASKSLVIGKRLAGLSEVRLVEELKKCQLLCSTCHQAKSVSDLGNKTARGQHGTLSSYRYCKCDLCRSAKRDWMREYRNK
jgi:5-methylcytosine-specific restriction endonuclease McrA